MVRTHDIRHRYQFLIGVHTPSSLAQYDDWVFSNDVIHMFEPVEGSWRRAGGHFRSRAEVAVHLFVRWSRLTFYDSLLHSLFTFPLSLCSIATFLSVRSPSDSTIPSSKLDTNEHAYRLDNPLVLFFVCLRTPQRRR